MNSLNNISLYRKYIAITKYQEVFAKRQQLETEIIAFIKGCDIDTIWVNATTNYEHTISVLGNIDEMENHILLIQHSYKNIKASLDRKTQAELSNYEKVLTSKYLSPDSALRAFLLDKRVRKYTKYDYAIFLTFNLNVLLIAIPHFYDFIYKRKEESPNVLIDYFITSCSLNYNNDIIPLAELICNIKSFTNSPQGYFFKVADYTEWKLLYQSLKGYYLSVLDATPIHEGVNINANLKEQICNPDSKEVFEALVRNCLDGLYVNYDLLDNSILDLYKKLGQVIDGLSKGKLSEVIDAIGKPSETMFRLYSAYFHKIKRIGPKFLEVLFLLMNSNLLGIRTEVLRYILSNSPVSKEISRYYQLYFQCHPCSKKFKFDDSTDYTLIYREFNSSMEGDSSFEISGVAGTGFGLTLTHEQIKALYDELLNKKYISQH